MKHKILILVLAIFLFLPVSINAKVLDSYKDIVANYYDIEVEEDKVNLYLFYGRECPHCEEEREMLDVLREEAKEYLNIYEFEVWHDKENSNIMETIKAELEITKTGVPFTVIGDKGYVGYSSAMHDVFVNKINEYIDNDSENLVKIPILGSVNLKKVSLPVLAVVLGFVDGFNPCAMWILLFLINMLFGVKNKMKRWVLGITFLFVSGLVYFLSMIGINFVLGVATINWMKIAIAIFILVAGILNLKKYLKIRKEEAGCTVVDSKKRKKIITKMKKIIEGNNFIFALIGITTLAVSVNLIELACSLGFPLIFTETLTLNSIHGITKLIYLLIYILFYMIDDMFVFTVSMVTLEATGITNKYNKLCTLVSAIIMILMGVLLIFKPDWLMLNF